jgi:hypothetical protein
MGAVREMGFTPSLNSSTLNPDLLIISRKVPLAISLLWCTGTVSGVRPGHSSRTCEPL